MTSEQTAGGALLRLPVLTDATKYGGLGKVLDVELPAAAAAAPWWLTVTSEMLSGHTHFTVISLLFIANTLLPKM
jgi:hypothetical protein